MRSRTRPSAAHAAGKTIWRALSLTASAIDAGLDAVTAIPLDRLHRANKARAMSDATYAEIESRRHIDGSALITMMSAERHLGIEEWNTQDEILDSLAHHPWWEKPARALSRRHLSVFLRRVEHAAQRVTRGWDDTAVWSMDDHLARTVGAQLTELSRIAHGHPVSDEFPTFESWTEALAGHGAALTAYASRWDKELDDSAEFPALYAAAQDALRWVADHLDCLWD